MSYSKGIANCLKVDEKNENFSEFNDDTLISYIENSGIKQEFYEAMKNGYEEMATINEECANYCSTSDYCTFIEYETWLCGV